MGDVGVWTMTHWIRPLSKSRLTTSGSSLGGKSGIFERIPPSWYLDMNVKGHYFNIVGGVRDIGCLTSHATIFQSYMWRHIYVKADWRRLSYGRTPNAIDRVTPSEMPCIKLFLFVLVYNTWNTAGLPTIRFTFIIIVETWLLVYDNCTEIILHDMVLTCRWFNYQYFIKEGKSYTEITQNTVYLAFMPILGMTGKKSDFFYLR